MPFLFIEMQPYNTNVGFFKLYIQIDFFVLVLFKIFNYTSSWREIISVGQA